MKARQPVKHPPISFNLLKKPYQYKSNEGFERLLAAAETSEDLFRIAFMSDKHGQLALMEIKNRNQVRYYETWIYFQKKQFL